MNGLIHIDQTDYLISQVICVPEIDAATGADIETAYLAVPDKDPATGELVWIEQNKDSVSAGKKLGITDEVDELNRTLFPNTQESYWNKVSTPASKQILDKMNQEFDNTADKEQASYVGGITEEQANAALKRKDVASNLPKNKLAMLNLKDPLNAAIVEDIKQARVIVRNREYNELKARALRKSRGRPVSTTNIINEKFLALRNKNDSLSKKQLAILAKEMSVLNKLNKKRFNHVSTYKTPGCKKIEREMKKNKKVKSKSKSDPTSILKCKKVLQDLADLAATNKKISEASPVSTEKPASAKKVTFSQANLFGKMQFI